MWMSESSREKKCNYSKSGILQVSLGYIRRPAREEGEEQKLKAER